MKLVIHFLCIFLFINLLFCYFYSTVPDNAKIPDTVLNGNVSCVSYISSFYFLSTWLRRRFILLLVISLNSTSYLSMCKFSPFLFSYWCFIIFCFNSFRRNRKQTMKFLFPTTSVATRLAHLVTSREWASHEIALFHVDNQFANGVLFHWLLFRCQMVLDVLTYRSLFAHYSRQFLDKVW